MKADYKVIMEAKELMIGDWVINGNVPKQVLGVVGHKVLFPHNKTKMWFPIEACYPIHLTPEILDKNFDQMSIEDISVGYQDKDFYTYDKLYRIKESDHYQFSQLEEILSCDGVMLRYEDGRFFIDVEASDCDFGAYGATFKEIHYVHELQHALRLCGIDKEIVL